MWRIGFTTINEEFDFSAQSVDGWSLSVTFDLCPELGRNTEFNLPAREEKFDFFPLIYRG